MAVHERRVMEQIETFLAMGEHGAFVWPAYGLTAAVMVGFAVSSLRSLRSRRKTLQRLEEAAPEPRRRGGAAAP
jgi:heme exporter protein D